MITRKESRCQSINSPDIVKQGYLFVKRPPGNPWNRIKAWHKKFFILRDSGSELGAELSMYNSQADSLRNSCPSLGMFLRDTVHIGIASESHRFSNVLVVVFNGKSPLLLAAEDELTARSWMLALDLTSQNRSLKSCNIFSWEPSFHRPISYPSLSSEPSITTGSGSAESDTSGCSCAPEFIRESPTMYSSSSTKDNTSVAYTSSLTYTESDDFCLDNFITIGNSRERFPICFESTEASERVGLRGNLELVIFARGIGVARKDDYECFLLWPISVIRQYRLESYDKSNYSTKPRKGKNKLTLVTIEIGRRCLTGEGVYKFTSDQGREIMRQLKKAVNSWATHRARLTSSSSSDSNPGFSSLPRSCKRLVDPFSGPQSHRSAPNTPSVTSKCRQSISSVSTENDSVGYQGSLKHNRITRSLFQYNFNRNLTNCKFDCTRETNNNLNYNSKKFIKNHVNLLSTSSEDDYIDNTLSGKICQHHSNDITDYFRSKSESNIKTTDSDDCSYLEIFPSR